MRDASSAQPLRGREPSALVHPPHHGLLCVAFPRAHQWDSWTFLLVKQILVPVLLPASQVPGGFGGYSYDGAILLAQIRAPPLLLPSSPGCP